MLKSTARGIAAKVLAVVMTLGMLAVMTPTASASEAGTQAHFTGGSGGGMSVDWWGVWTDAQHMRQIDIKLCDSVPTNTNEATAGFLVALRNPTTGAITYQTAPTELWLPQGTATCGWKFDLSLGYGQQLYAVRVRFWGDEAPGDVWGTPWQYNPYV